MNIRAEQTEILTRRAAVASSSWNADTWEVEVTFATDKTGVLRYDGQGVYTEFLDVNGFSGAEGVAFLDNHNRASIDDVLGTVQSARATGQEARALIRLSRNHPRAQRIAADLSDGLHFPVSVGYSVQKWKAAADPNGVRTKTAIKWFVHEISAVPLPADPLARTRSQDMDPEITTPDAPPPANETATRAAINTEISTMAGQLGLAQGWIDSQIDRNASAEQARSAAIDELLQRSSNSRIQSNIRIGNDFTDPEFRARTLGEALYARLNPAHNLTEAARNYHGFSMMDLARDCLQTRGVAHTGLSTTKLVERALHSTSDFPLILGDAANRSTVDAYRALQSTLKAAARQVNATDFRTRHRVQLSEGPELEKLNQSGEIKAGSLVEAAESYKLETYARRFGISRQAIINDDLGLFADISRRMGQAAGPADRRQRPDERRQGGVPRRPWQHCLRRRQCKPVGCGG